MKHRMKGHKYKDYDDLEEKDEITEFLLLLDT